MKVDAPISRLISVPCDEDRVCRAEVCLERTPSNSPFDAASEGVEAMRFSVGERVACAVEAADGDDYGMGAREGSRRPLRRPARAPNLSLSDKLSLNVWAPSRIESC